MTEHWRAMNPPNGWGDYDRCLQGLRCGVDHGWECCGCLDHPVGKPWGWNSPAWDEHWNQPTESEADE